MGVRSEWCSSAHVQAGVEDRASAEASSSASDGESADYEAIAEFV